MAGRYPVARSLRGSVMPATSKAQFRFMEAVKHGGIKKPGLSPSKAAEFTDSTSYGSLPARAPKKRRSMREAVR